MNPRFNLHLNLDKSRDEIVMIFSLNANIPSQNINRFWTLSISSTLAVFYYLIMKEVLENSHTISKNVLYSMWNEGRQKLWK